LLLFPRGKLQLALDFQPFTSKHCMEEAKSAKLEIQQNSGGNLGLQVARNRSCKLMYIA
jgi:hypothetical protein